VTFCSEMMMMTLGCLQSSTASHAS
jgi:hypothetical protein